MSQTDPKALERLIRFPFRPKSVRFETSEQPGGNDWSLIALLHFEPSQVREIVRAAEPTSRKGAQVAREHLLGWFPPAVAAKYKDVPATEPSVTVDAVRIEVSAFIAPEKSPLTSGSAAVFEAEGLVYLGLHTM